MDLFYKLGFRVRFEIYGMVCFTNGFSKFKGFYFELMLSIILSSNFGDEILLRGKECNDPEF